MIGRRARDRVERGLDRQAAVCLLGPRQAGKTTLALEIAASRDSIYLDLESAPDRARLSEPEAFLDSHRKELVILDEVQRLPGLFETLRGVIDRGRREGAATGRFLMLGSASGDLLRQTGESLAGRVSYLELGPFSIDEISGSDLDDLWVRGGFPPSFTATDGEVSLEWRQDFIRTYLERDILQLGQRVPAETMRRLWTMLAHQQGSMLNASRIASGLGVSVVSVIRYIDLLVDLMLVRRLPPWTSNVGKRLVKSPKTYVRDSGLVHALLGIDGLDSLLGHPVVGPSWEGHIIESFLAVDPFPSEASFYRTSNGAEIDLLLAGPGRPIWAVEIKRSTAPRVERGLRSSLDEIKPAKSFIVYPGKHRYPLAGDIEAIGPAEMAELVAARAD